MATSENWHMSKSVPVTLILAILIQTATAVWWASSINEKVGRVELDIVATQTLQQTNTRELQAENLRQWERINSAEDTIDEVSATVRTTVAILQRVEEQVKESNELLKELLRKE